MSMADLVAAGAPELPEGWFYRVMREYGAGYKVEIREQGRVFSREVAYAWVQEGHFDDMTEAVVHACRMAAGRAGDRAELRRKFAALARYEGDHDPKGGR
ncbi:hypothetical protein J7I94_19205 [Streptomyces sp. ISL-12]|uniref:hypothetical protein n=1 Tax=Streptomyces sp. ISL-12 TaxID=2819177 RepID=UPI001BE587F9|nr:hypothetical protein [Streptomyces sp. ISL-12]MBT2412663.1 hypothetical protein [Streptomyces sp. ISL-12]